ncbi:MAG: NAD-binding protein [Chloroflexi bacterium]|nr:NAD-binding protein [Chloroflexota bacterium]
MKRFSLRGLFPGGRLAGALLALGLTLAVGTAGYMVIAGYSFIDALYQTVTTLSTVGFREVEPFGTAEKIFTIVLILFGTGTVLYTLTLMVEQTLEGNIRSRFYHRRMKMQIEELEDHYILCGFGRVGREIAKELRERGARFVIIEQTPAQAEVARAFGYLVVEGDGSQDITLNRAGISRARCLLAASDSDSGNTYITLTAKSMNPHCYIVARVGYPHNEEKLRLAGADRVLSLYSLGGRRMVLSALQPLAADIMDTLATGRHGDLLLAEFEVSEKNGLAGKTCSHLTSHAPNASILGLRHRSGALVVGPKAEDTMHDGDIVIVLAEEQDIAALSNAAGVSI